MEIQKKNILLIERLITAQNRTFPTVEERLAYERGYLTGFLARLVQDDSNIAHIVLHKISKSSENSGGNR